MVLIHLPSLLLYTLHKLVIAHMKQFLFLGGLTVQAIM